MGDGSQLLPSGCCRAYRYIQEVRLEARWLAVSRLSKAGVVVLIVIALASPLSLPRVAASSVTISGAGASFPAPLIENWASTYHGLYSNVSISYSPVGSGAGISGITHGTAEFAGSDLPLTDAQRQNFPGLTLLPGTLGGIALAYNIPGVHTSVSLNFTSEVIVEIYNGTINRWSDSGIQSLNPGVTLPITPVTPVHRSDASGTTYSFTRFLSVTNSWWANRVGFGSLVAWPTNTSAGVGALGDLGVAAVVSGNSGFVGYVGLSYAKQSNLGIGAVENSQGNFVTPTLQAITYAAANATVVNVPTPLDLRLNIINAAGASSYPIATYSYIVVWRDMSMDPSATVDKAVALARFLWWAVHDGQAAAPGFFFAPLPPVVAGADETLLRFLTYSGQQLLPPSYLPGVLPGDEATYGSVASSWASNVPPSLFSIPIPPIIQPFLNASGIGLVVETVSGSSVTAAQTLNYLNGTSHASTITGDLARDNSSLTPWVVAGGLHPGDHLYGSASGIFGAATINYTITRVFAGVSRLLNVYNATFIYMGAHVSIVACWDQATGVLVSVDFSFSLVQTNVFGTFYAKGSGSARLTETNMWSATPSFELNADNLVWNVKSGSGQNILLTVSSLDGFGGQVAIVPVVPVGVHVSGVNPSTVDVPVNGSATSTLSITVPETMPAGGYSFTVAGSGGSGVSRSVKFTLSVVGDFAVSIRGSVPMVQTGSAVKVFVELYSLGFSGQAGLTVSVSPEGLTAAVADSSLVLSPGGTVRTNLTLTASSGTALGPYTVTVVGTKGSVSHSTTEIVTVIAGSVPASTSHSSILGLDPPTFYGTLLAVAVLVAGGVLIVWRRRRMRIVLGSQPGLPPGGSLPSP